MNTYVHLLWPFPLITRINADISRLRKTTVGRRCDQKTLLQRFLAQPDGQHGLRPCAALAAQFSSSPQIHPKFLFRTSVFSVTSVFKLRSVSAPSAEKNLTDKWFGHKRTQSTQRVFLYDLCDPSWLKISIRNN
jgi:hypothetical protein